MKKTNKQMIAVVSIILIISAIILITKKSKTPEVPPPVVQATSTPHIASPDDLTMYANNTLGFALKHPSNFTISESYEYQGFGPGKGIKGVSFTVPSLFTEGTNLSKDSYVGIEQLPEGAKCTAHAFINNKDVIVSSTTEAGLTYSFASSTEAGAGNRYEETVYAFPGKKSCYAVRYFVHYSAIENYPAGQVKEFDAKKIESIFNAIRISLVVMN